jgi:hypothetical protein
MDLISTTFDYRHTPRLWDYHGILDALQKIAPEAHIAGGAVRDNLLEKPIADIATCSRRTSNRRGCGPPMPRVRLRQNQRLAGALSVLCSAHDARGQI